MKRSKKIKRKRCRVLHCWAGNKEDLEFGSEEWIESWDKPNATCFLPAGHKGPHKWIPDNEIMVKFK